MVLCPGLPLLPVHYSPIGYDFDSGYKILIRSFSYVENNHSYFVTVSKRHGMDLKPEKILSFFEIQFSSSTPCDRIIWAAA